MGRRGLLLVTITPPRFAMSESVRPIERPSPITASRPRRTALSRWAGAGHCGRRLAAATGSRLARFAGLHGRGQRHSRLASRRVVPAGAEVQVHPAVLPLSLVVDLALTAVLAAGLEGKQFRVPREHLQSDQRPQGSALWMTPKQVGYHFVGVRRSSG
jgi:hypothetical protein